jgi:hypothetical protein
MLQFTSLQLTRSLPNGFPQLLESKRKPRQSQQVQGDRRPENDRLAGTLVKIRFDQSLGGTYAVRVEKGNVSAFASPRASLLLRLPLPRSLTGYVGRGLFRFLLTMQGLGAFALITLGVIITRFGDARQVIRPRVFQELARSGLRLPMEGCGGLTNSIFISLVRVLGLILELMFAFAGPRAS